MSQNKKIISNNKSLLVAAPLIASLSCGISVSFAEESNTTLDNTLISWHPYKNYINMLVPQDILNQAVPVGITLGELAEIVELTYKEGVSPLYVKGILVANKQFALPSSFNSGEDLVARQKFEEMKNAASADGVYLNAFSTYRSYERQVDLYSRYVARDGQEAADKYSAKPGHSEHQTGLTFDIGGKDSSVYASTRFTGTKEEIWLSNNAHKYGFILRYPEGKEDITEYMYESWHYRYVGTEWSSKIHESALTLEEFLGLDKLEEVTSHL